MQGHPKLYQAGDNAESSERLFSHAWDACFENADAEDVQTGVDEENAHDHDGRQEFPTIWGEQQSADSQNKRADSPFTSGRISAVHRPDVDERKRLQKALERERNCKESVIKKVMHERLPRPLRRPYLSKN